MDKDNLGIQRIFSRLTKERMASVRGETQEQLLTAFILMLAGLLLVMVGFCGLIMRLVHVAGCNILILAQRLGLVRRIETEPPRRHFPGDRRRSEPVTPTKQSPGLQTRS